MIVLLFQFLESTLRIKMLPKYNWGAWYLGPARLSFLSGD